MINYSLAKVLKEAGFPQHHDDGISQHWAGTKIKSCYCPPLEELIEACGDKFFSIELFPEGFCAKGLVDKGCVSVTEAYDTPASAVANLWLKLNEKPTP